MDHNLGTWVTGYVAALVIWLVGVLVALAGAGVVDGTRKYIPSNMQNDFKKFRAIFVLFASCAGFSVHLTPAAFRLNYYILL